MTCASTEMVGLPTVGLLPMLMASIVITLLSEFFSFSITEEIALIILTLGFAFGFSAVVINHFSKRDTKYNNYNKIKSNYKCESLINILPGKTKNNNKTLIC